MHGLSGVGLKFRIVEKGRVHYTGPASYILVFIDHSCTFYFLVRIREFSTVNVFFRTCTRTEAHWLQTGGLLGDDGLSYTVDGQEVGGLALW